MKSRTTLAALACATLSCGADTEVQLDVTVIIPAEVSTIESGVLRLSLWSFDEMIADVSATLVDTDEALFAHVLGQRNDFLMHVAGDIGSGLRHYITVRGCEITPEGEVHVLWDGIEGLATPSEVEMRYIGPSGGCDD
jgi:hypothetical protein